MGNIIFYAETEYWEECDSDIDEDLSSNIPPKNVDLSSEAENSQESSTLLKWIVYLLLTFQCKFSLSDQALGWLITFFYLVLKAMGKFSKEADHMAKNLPQTLYSHRQAVSGLFGKVDNFDKFSVCKKCHTLYRMNVLKDMDHEL